MEPINLAAGRASHDDHDEPYHDVPAGTLDEPRPVRAARGRNRPESPHAEDEVYHVLDGRARVRIADEEYPVEPGDVVFVEKETDHRFVDIEADLELLVMFAPAEGTLAGDG